MKNAIQINNAVLTISLRRRTNMKIKQTLILIASVALCALAAPLTRAQCPQTCDSNDNTAIGSSAAVGFAQNVAVGAMALSPSASEDNVAVGFAAMADAVGIRGKAPPAQGEPGSRIPPGRTRGIACWPVKSCRKANQKRGASA